MQLLFAFVQFNFSYTYLQLVQNEVTQVSLVQFTVLQTLVYPLNSFLFHIDYYITFIWILLLLHSLECEHSIFKQFHV